MGQPCICISEYIDQMFNGDWDCVDDETRKMVHFSNLVLSRLADEFWKWEIELPDWC